MPLHFTDAELAERPALFADVGAELAPERTMAFLAEHIG